MPTLQVVGGEDIFYYGKDFGSIEVEESKGLALAILTRRGWREIEVREQVPCASLFCGGIWRVTATALGTAKVTLRHRDDAGNDCGKYEHALFVIRLNMSIDSNRDGRVDTDEPGEQNWVWGAGHPGAILLVNNDADPDELHRCPENKSELAEIHIAPTGLKSFPVGYSLKLCCKESEAYLFSVYRKTGDGKLARIMGEDSGGNRPGQKLSQRLSVDGEVLYIEATELPAPDFEGLLTLELHLIKAGVSMAYDRVVFRVAPWIMTPNTQRPLRVYAVEIKGENGTVLNKEFLGNLGRACQRAKVAFYKVDGAEYGNDLWIQDEIEFGYCEAPTHSIPVVFDGPRDRGLDSFPEMELLGPDFGHFHVEGLRHNSLNGFGNLEVSPPVTVRGRGYPFGRIIFGGKKYGHRGGWSRQMGSEIRRFLFAQKIQYPIELFSHWLKTGHIDEFLCFAPAEDATGFKVVLASPERCYRLLKDLAASGHGRAVMFEEFMGRGIGLGKSVAPSIDALLEDEAFWKFNFKCQRFIDWNRRILIRELGLNTDDFIDVPVLFKDGGGGRASALFPNMVNHLALGAYCLAPKPYGPKIQGQDVFEQAFRDVVPYRKVIFIEDWRMYHDNHADIHCATNVLREPFKDRHWWEYKPPGGFDL